MSAHKSEGCGPFLKALADETRWRIVGQLLSSALTISELANRLKVSPSNVSKHVRILREAGILDSKKQGRHLRCEISPNFNHQVQRDQRQLDLGCCVFRFEKKSG